jgi:hypothetical protein
MLKSNDDDEGDDDDCSRDSTWLVPGSSTSAASDRDSRTKFRLLASKKHIWRTVAETDEKLRLRLWHEEEVVIFGNQEDVSVLLVAGSERRRVRVRGVRVSGVVQRASEGNRGGKCVCGQVERKEAH